MLGLRVSGSRVFRMIWGPRINLVSCSEPQVPTAIMRKVHHVQNIPSYVARVFQVTSQESEEAPVRVQRL